MDESKLLSRVQHLAHSLFIANEEGREFLKLMKILHIDTPALPQTLETIDKHGGPLGWLAFREGQITLIRSLQALANNFSAKIDAENKGGK